MVHWDEVAIKIIVGLAMIFLVIVMTMLIIVLGVILQDAFSFYSGHVGHPVVNQFQMIDKTS